MRYLQGLIAIMLMVAVSVTVLFDIWFGICSGIFIFGVGLFIDALRK